MEIICANKAFSNPESITINPPPEVQQMRANVKIFRDAAAEIENGSLKAAPSAAQPSGGVMGMLTKAAEVATDAAVGVAGAGIAIGLKGLADALDKATTEIETPFKTVAKDVIEKNKTAMINVYVNYINGFTFTQPVQIIRGEAPWNAENYKKVPGDAISKCLSELAKKDVVPLLLPVAQQGIDEHPVTKGWGNFIDLFNQACDALGKYISLEEKGIKKVELKLPEYVCSEICNEIAKLMAAEEIATRADPKNKDAEKPFSFAKVFSTVPLTDSDYNEWKSMVQVQK